MKIKFVFFLFIVSQLTHAQEKHIKVFEKKTNKEIITKLTDVNLHLIAFPLGKKVFYILVNQNKSWEIEEVNFQEWQELPGNTLIVVQSLEDESVKNQKKQPEPILLSNFTFNEFKLTNKEIANYAISWSMDTLYAADSSVQTSKKIENSNCCDKGTCSVLVSLERKNDKIHLISVNR